MIRIRITAVPMTMLLAIILVVIGRSQLTAADYSPQFIWQDTFDGPAGQSPDAAKWDYDIGTGWGNAQLEYDTDRPENVSLDGNGNLAIIAREESYMGQAYTSARIVTRDLYEFTYGRVEARIKLPSGQGIWPAFWLLGSDIGFVGWPQCGEIDVMEYLGHETDIAYGSLHGPGYSGGEAISQSYQLESGTFDSSFHVFAVEWEPDVIRWYVDDVLYSTVIPEDLGGNEWVFDHPFYIILNVAVGGNWPGPPDASTVFPQTMLVDYVRVQGATTPSCCDVPGDANGDYGVNVGDPVFVINHIFKDGPEPSCLEEGDANCDLQLNIGDAVYLINYIFRDGAEPCCPVIVNPGIVFDDDFATGVTYEAFAGSLPGAVQVSGDSIYAGTQGLEITIPGSDPWWSGGAFTDYAERDLTAFNALTFWARAGRTVTLDVAGIGNDNTGTSRYTADVNNLVLSTNWQKITIPIPLSDKLDAERGLFYFAEGAENGSGCTIWIDEITFEYTETITNPRPAIPSQTFNVESGTVIDPGSGTVLFDVDGSDVTVNAMPGYFTFVSSNPSVVAVDPEGVITAAGSGSAVVTAALGGVEAAGVITVTVFGDPATAAPPPTADPADVISLFSDVYTDIFIDTWSASWDMADVEDYSIGSDGMKKYTSLVFAGIEFASNTVDASAMTHFHMDVWTPDATSSPAVFHVKLVDFGADGSYGGGDDSEHELTFDESTMNTGSWVSIDVPLSDFMTLNSRSHLAQLIISGDPGTVFVDNIYFYR